MLLRLHPLLCVLVLSLASLAQKSGQQKPDGVPDTCPVTNPSDKPLVPPCPYPPPPYFSLRQNRLTSYVVPRREEEQELCR